MSAGDTEGTKTPWHLVVSNPGKGLHVPEAAVKVLSCEPTRCSHPAHPLPRNEQQFCRGREALNSRLPRTSLSHSTTGKREQKKSQGLLGKCVSLGSPSQWQPPVQSGNEALLILSHALVRAKKLARARWSSRGSLSPSQQLLGPGLGGQGCWGVLYSWAHCSWDVVGAHLLAHQSPPPAPAGTAAKVQMGTPRKFIYLFN